MGATFDKKETVNGLFMINFPTFGGLVLVDVNDFDVVSALFNIRSVMPVFSCKEDAQSFIDNNGLLGADISTLDTSIADAFANRSVN